VRIKSLLILLCALLILVLGGILPRLVSRQLDAGYENQVQFAPVEGVNLEFVQISGRTVEQTLAILGGARSAVDIPMELANLPREKAEQIALTAAEKYREAGILLGDAPAAKIPFCQTALYYGPDNQSNIFWKIHCSDKEGTFVFSVILDDRTGTVCAVEYTHTQKTYVQEDLERVLGGFAQLYLDGMGEAFFDVDAKTLLGKAHSPADGSYLAAEFSWDGGGYGTCRMTFFVNESGFYTYFNGTNQK